MSNEDGRTNLQVIGTLLLSASICVEWARCLSTATPAAAVTRRDDHSFIPMPCMSLALTVAGFNLCNSICRRLARLLRTAWLLEREAMSSRALRAAVRVELLNEQGPDAPVLRLDAMSLRCSREGA